MEKYKLRFAAMGIDPDDMIEIEPKPYVDDNGVEHPNLDHFVGDEGYYIIQAETGRLFADAVDNHPSQYHYIQSDIKIGEENNNQDADDGDEIEEDDDNG